MMETVEGALIKYLPANCSIIICEFLRKEQKNKWEDFYQHAKIRKVKVVYNNTVQNSNTMTFVLQIYF